MLKGLLTLLLYLFIEAEIFNLLNVMSGFLRKEPVILAG